MKGRPKTKNTTSVSVSIPLDFLAEVDEIAYFESLSRSEFIVEALHEKVKKYKEKQGY